MKSTIFFQNIRLLHNIIPQYGLEKKNNIYLNLL